jgi:hypothetical protein
MRRLVPALSVLLTACGAQPLPVPGAAAHAVPAPIERRDPEARVDPDARIPSCGGAPRSTAPLASDEARERAAASARTPSRWGKGFRTLRPPRGFHTVHAPSGDDLGDLVKAFAYQPGEFEVTVEIFDHPAAPAREQSLLRYVVRAFDANGEDLDDIEVDEESFTSWFDRVAELRDEADRRIVEWAYVEKGCESSERYERFIEDGDHLWHIRMVVSPSAPEEDLLLWMALFFDAPLAGPAPSDRRGLAGKGTTR